MLRTPIAGGTEPDGQFRGRAGLSKRGAWLLGIAASLTITAGIVIGLFEWNWLRSSAIALGSSQSGRSFSIERIAGEWAWRPQFRLDGVRQGNVDKAVDRDMLAADSVE